MEKPVDKFDEIRAELLAIARAKVVDCIDYSDGRAELRPLAELPPDALAAISQIERGPGGCKVRFYDKLRAIELLLKLDGVAEAVEDNNLIEILLEDTKNDEEWLDEDGVFITE